MEEVLAEKREAGQLVHVKVSTWSSNLHFCKVCSCCAKNKSECYTINLAIFAQILCLTVPPTKITGRSPPKF